MGLQAIKLFTLSEYLESELTAFEKHEYFDGEVITMTGASINHSNVVINFISKIATYLKHKEFSVYATNLRVATPNGDAFMYPDLSIVCGDFELKKHAFDTLINPSVIIEVLSPSTKSYDMDMKLYYYKQIPSLKEYIIIDPDQFYAKKYTKQSDNSWDVQDITREEAVLYIQTIQLQLNFSDIYYRVAL